VTPQKINRVSFLLLLLGFGSALVIYLTVASASVDPLVGDPLDTKKYRRELEYYGGKANVLSAEFMDWFAGLWHGRPLAFTIATLTVAGTLAFRFVATPPPDDSGDSGETDKKPKAPTMPIDAGPG